MQYPPPLPSPPLPSPFPLPSLSSPISLLLPFLPSLLPPFPPLPSPLPFPPFFFPTPLHCEGSINPATVLASVLMSVPTQHHQAVMEQSRRIMEDSNIQ